MLVHFALFALLPTSAVADDDSLQAVAPDASTYFQIERDYRKCVSPLCGGYWVSALNVLGLRCADGNEGIKCYVAEIDWTATGLDDRQISELEAVIDDGDEVILKGALDAEEFKGFGVLGVLDARTAWTSVQDHSTVIDHFRVEDLGFVCVAAPCFNMRAHLVNTIKRADFSDLDLSGVAATPDELALADEARRDGTLLIPGALNPGIDDIALHPQPVTLTAESFYLPVAAH